MKITAVIPNYNGLENLKLLIPNILQQGFDSVYVIDDASTDESVAYIREHFPEVNVIAGPENLGPGGNRNRIIEHVTDGILFFIDADMELPDQSIRTTVENAFSNDSVGMVGWLIMTTENEPMWWNYGYEMNPVRNARAHIFETIADEITLTNEQKTYLKTLARPNTYNLDIMWTEPEEREVDWVAEGFFCVRANTFAKVGGYDTKFRYHECHDLCKRIRETLNQKVIFSPTLNATHLEINVRAERKENDSRESEFYFFQKHWGMSRDIFDRLYPKRHE